MTDARAIVEAIFNGDPISIKEAITKALNNRKQIATESYKVVFAEEMLFVTEDEELEEAPKSATGKRMARVSRIRGGVVQRRKLVTQKKGYKMVNGRVVRMSASEKKNRHMAQVRAARKRRGTLSRALRKRARSNKIRKTRGL